MKRFIEEKKLKIRGNGLCTTQLQIKKKVTGRKEKFIMISGKTKTLS